MSAKRKHTVPKNGPVWHMSAEEATLAQMPRFNAHACGTGAHGDAKYNRAREKRTWQREIDREGACNRRPLSFGIPSQTCRAVLTKRVPQRRETSSGRFAKARTV